MTVMGQKTINIKHIQNLHFHPYSEKSPILLLHVITNYIIQLLLLMHF